MTNKVKKRLTDAWRRELSAEFIELLEKPAIIDIVEQFEGTLIDASVRPETPSECESRTHPSSRRGHAD